MKTKLPTSGTFAKKTSNAWNFPRKKFQGLELLKFAQLRAGHPWKFASPAYLHMRMAGEP